MRWTSMLLCILPLALLACAPADIVSPPGEDLPEEPALIALDAYRGENRYFLRYELDGEEYFTTGDLRPQSPLASPAPAAIFDVPRLSTMEPARAARWQQLTASAAAIPVLGTEHWFEFRDQLFGELLPAESHTGIAVGFDRTDYFFFYDKEGRFRVRRLIDKPADYSVREHIDLRDYFQRWQPRLNAFLASRGIQSSEVLFNTGNLGRGAIPFVYISGYSKLIVLVQYDELSIDAAPAVPGSHILMSLWHFVESHTYAIPMRPFSSVQSLLSLAGDTAMESGRRLLDDIPEGEAGPLASGPGMDLVAWEAELDERLGRPASLGELDFLVDGKGFFPRFIDAVTSAQESVDLRAYIFDNDDVALQIAELLKRRSNEGVEVRVLYDGLGTVVAGGERADTLPDGHEPPLSMHQWLEQDARVSVREVKNFWLTGDHAKTMVIDRQLAFLGGMNIGREYRYEWHDLMVEVRGPVVDEINDQFDSAWARAGLLGDFGMMFRFGKSERNMEGSGYPVRLIYTEPGRQEIYKLQRDAIRRAKRYVYIENAYFTEDMLLKELILARRRGVDVRVIIPLETDNGAITRNIALAANIMLEHGIRVYIYPGFTHAKAAIFDGWACVGSANLDRLSMRVNREMNITTSEPAAVDELLSELFLPDFSQSRELTSPFPERWTDQLIEMFGDYVF